MADRVTSLTVETASGGDQESRVTILAVETASGGVQEVRVTELVVETVSPIWAPVRITDFVVETVSPVLPSPEQEFDPDSDIGGETIGLTWVELLDASGGHHISSKTPLPDPANYYYGWKEDEVTEWDTIRRSLSDSKGVYEGTSFTWRVSDTARRWRAMLAAAGTRLLLNRPVVIRMISDASRREP